MTLYLGDCREILPRLELKGTVSLVTDPPYGVAFDRATWEDDIDAYEGFMRSWLPLVERLVGDGPCFVWQAMLNAPRWHRWFPSTFRILAACKGFTQYRPTPIQYAWDPVIFWGTPVGEPSVWRRDYHMQNLAPFGANRPKVAHPCPRPLEAAKYVVELAGGNVILDPFAGSGTTLLAAKTLGRRAVGIEIEERYCEIAARRLSQDVLPLFETRLGAD